MPVLGNHRIAYCQAHIVKFLMDFVSIMRAIGNFLWSIFAGALMGLLGNSVRFLLAGVWLALCHVGSAVACFFTIIGIPFGIQHLKLAGIALAPVGKTIVSKELAAAARERSAQAELARFHGN